MYYKEKKDNTKRKKNVFNGLDLENAHSTSCPTAGKIFQLQAKIGKIVSLLVLSKVVILNN
jgi:hypothetical protein